MHLCRVRGTLGNICTELLAGTKKDSGSDEGPVAATLRKIRLRGGCLVGVALLVIVDVLEGETEGEDEGELVGDGSEKTEKEVVTEREEKGKLNKKSRDPRTTKTVNKNNESLAFMTI
jgi:hypothetical protein